MVTFDAKEGRGCSHCEDGTPMAYFQRVGGGIIRLCVDCLMQWFPSVSTDWIEERLGYFIDHIDYRLAMAHWKEAYAAGFATLADKPKMSEFIAKVPALKRA